MDFCHIYQEMFTALQQGGLDRVAEAAYSSTICSTAPE